MNWYKGMIFAIIFFAFLNVVVGIIIEFNGQIQIDDQTYQELQQNQLSPQYTINDLAVDSVQETVNQLTLDYWLLNFTYEYKDIYDGGDLEKIKQASIFLYELDRPQIGLN